LRTTTVSLRPSSHALASAAGAGFGSSRAVACVPSPKRMMSSIGAASNIARCRFRISSAVVRGGINSWLRRYQFSPLPFGIDSISRPLSWIELTERGWRESLCT
jgi:hypothetical protein